MGLIYFLGVFGLIAMCINLFILIKYWDVLTDKKK